VYVNARDDLSTFACRPRTSDGDLMSPPNEFLGLETRLSFRSASRCREVVPCEEDNSQGSWWLRR